MQVREIKIENFKNIESFSQQFSGGVYLVKGDNELGKTTLITAIMAILTGERSDNILQQGKDRGFVKGKIGDRYEVELRFTDKNPRGTLSIKDLETGFEKNKGAKTLLQQLFDFSDFDAHEFVKWSETAEGRRKQIEEIKSLLPEETREAIKRIDQEIPQLKEDRKQKRAIYKDRKSQLKGFNITDEDLAKKERKDIERLKAEKQRIRKKLNDDFKARKRRNEEKKEDYEKKLGDLNAEISAHNEKVDEKISVLKDLETAISQVKHTFGVSGEPVKMTIESLENSQRNIAQAIPEKRIYEEEVKQIPEPEYEEEMPDNTDLNNIDQEIDEAYEYNNIVEQVENYWHMKGEVNKLYEELEQIQEKITNRTQERLELIQKAELPIEGLSFTEDELYLNDIPVRPGEISTSQAMNLAFSVAIAKNQKVQVFKIAQGESLGEERLKLLVDLAEKKGFQGFIERVTNDELKVDRYYEKGTEPDRNNQPER